MIVWFVIALGVWTLCLLLWTLAIFGAVREIKERLDQNE